MTEHPSVQELRRNRRNAWLRLLALGVLAIALIIVVRETHLTDAFSEEGAAAMRDGLGAFAAPVFVLGFSVLIALWVPGTVLSTAVIAVFGTAGAIPINYLGAVFGAAMAFAVARGVGGNALHELFDGRFTLYERYRTLMDRHGFETILYLRIIPTPYTLICYAAGLSRLPFTKYIIATALGILPGSVALTLLLGTVLESVRGGEWSALWSMETALAAAIFLPVLMLPRAAAYARRKWDWFGGFTDEEIEQIRDLEDEITGHTVHPQPEG